MAHELNLGIYQEHKYRVITPETEERAVPKETPLRFMEMMFRKIHIGRLALHGDVYPYVIPMNHYYEKGAFYWHCGFKGKKIDLIKKNPKACYVVDGPIEPLKAKEKYYHQGWHSVVCYGELSQVTDPDEKIRIISAYSTYYGGPLLGIAMRERTCNLMKLSIETMTGRYGRFTPAENRVLLVWDFKRDGYIDEVSDSEPGNDPYGIL